MNTQPTLKREGNAGNHRSDSAHNLRHQLILVAILATLILLGVATFFFLTDNDESRTTPSKPSMPSPSLTDSTKSASSSPEPSSAGEVTTPADLPTAAASSPRRLILDGQEIGFDESLTDQVDHLIPRTTAELSRWDARGRPASPSDSAVVIVGKAKVGGGFENLDSVATGDEISIRTDTGVFTYTVTQVGRIQVENQVANPDLEDSPGRLLLVGSQYDAADDRATEDILVTAQLTDVVPN